MRQIDNFIEHYFFKDFILKLDGAIHLVEVEFMPQPPSQQDHPSILPSWIFEPETVWVRYKEGLVAEHQKFDPDPVKEYLISGVSERRIQRGRRGVQERRSYNNADRRVPHTSIERSLKIVYP